jgi:ABC-type proline/glycine betaine transport system ATPase subunit
MLWVSWPKKTSPLYGGLSGGDVRRIGLAGRLVDVKVCAVDEDWSALKFVRRVQDR